MNATASNMMGDLVKDWPSEEERFYTAIPDLVGTREYTDKTRSFINSRSYCEILFIMLKKNSPTIELVSIF